MPVDPVLAAVTRGIAREHNSLKADLRDLRQATPTYQRGTVQSVDLVTYTAVVSLRGVSTDPLRFTSSYLPVVGDDVVVQQVGTDAIILGALAVDPWHVVTGGEFENGWTNFGGAFGVARYRISSDGRAYLDGLVKNGTMGAAIFTLPVAPTAEQVFAVVTQIGGADGLGRVDVDGGGHVIAASGTNNYVSLAGISVALN